MLNDISDNRIEKHVKFLSYGKDFLLNSSSQYPWSKMTGICSAYGSALAEA